MKNNSYQIIKDCKIGKNTKLWAFLNLYGCIIGDDCVIGSFVEIQNGVTIGNNVKIQSHAFICEGVTIEDTVFVGHNVVFINDKYPRAVTAKGKLKSHKDWNVSPVVVKKGSSIGSNATILCGVTIGEYAMVGAGSVVTKDVPAYSTVVGIPARVIKTKK